MFEIFWWWKVFYEKTFRLRKANDGLSVLEESLTRQEKNYIDIISLLCTRFSIVVMAQCRGLWRASGQRFIYWWRVKRTWWMKLCTRVRRHVYVSSWAVHRAIQSSEIIIRPRSFREPFFRLRIHPREKIYAHVSLNSPFLSTSSSRK